jgi:hypothetical protein
MSDIEIGGPDFSFRTLKPPKIKRPKSSKGKETLKLFQDTEEKESLNCQWEP